MPPRGASSTRPSALALGWALLIAGGLLAACSSQSTPHDHAGAAGTAGPPPLFTDLGRHHRAITSTSPQAQAYFDQGLRLLSRDW